LLAARLTASGQFTVARIAGPLGISRRRVFDRMNARKSGSWKGLWERPYAGGASRRSQGWRRPGGSLDCDRAGWI